MPGEAEVEPDTGTQWQRRAERVARPERELEGAATVRLYVFRDKDFPLPALVEGDRLIPLHWSLTAMLSEEGTVQAQVDGQLQGYEGAKGLARNSVKPAAPIEPGKIVCVGLNYKDHVTEGGRAGPDRPLLFSKFANAVVASGEPIVRPEGTHALDLEVELGVVIGKTARRVKQGDAMSHVAGYVVVNDVSARDWQGIPAALHEGETGDGQWIRAKGSDTFLPMGPDFVTADELDPAAGLRLRSWLISSDGKEQLMQDSTTASMIWSIPALIEYISKAITLDPGDLIATGTPSGVGVFRDPPIFLEPGDRVRCEVEGIGSVDNPVIDWTEDPRDA